MYSLNVIYDYNENGSWPAWMIVKPKYGEFDWKKETIYLSLHTPFQRLDREDLDESDFGISITHTEIVVNTEHPDKIGIYIPRVKERIMKIRGDEFTPSFRMSDIRHFIIQMADIEIVTQMNPASILDFR